MCQDSTRSQRLVKKSEEHFIDKGKKQISSFKNGENTGQIHDIVYLPEKNRESFVLPKGAETMIMSGSAHHE